MQPIKLYRDGYFISRGYPTPNLLPRKRQGIQKKQAMLDLLIIDAAKKCAAEKGVDRNVAHGLVTSAIAHIREYPDEVMETLESVERQLSKSDLSPISARNQFLGLEENTIGVDHTFYFDADQFIKFAEYSTRSLSDLIEEKIDAAKLSLENLKLHTVVRSHEKSRLQNLPTDFGISIGDTFAEKLTAPRYTVSAIKNGCVEFDRELNVDVHLIVDDTWKLGVTCDRDSLYQLIKRVDGVSPIDEIYNFYLSEINGIQTEPETDKEKETEKTTEKKTSVKSKKALKTT